MASSTTDPGSRTLSPAGSVAEHSWAFMGKLVGIGAVTVYFLLASKLGIGFAIPVGILGVCGITAMSVLRGPVGRAWARRIDSAGGGAITVEELDALHARIEELEAGQQRMLELEERLDFTERLLTRSRDEQVAAEPAR